MINLIAGSISCCGTGLSLGMYGMEGWLFNTMPDWNVLAARSEFVESNSINNWLSICVGW